MEALSIWGLLDLFSGRGEIEFITHTGPHFDDCVGMENAACFLQAIDFPGADTINVSFHNDSGLYQGEDHEFHATRRRLLFGTGGGPLDEHETAYEGRKEGESVSTLVGKATGALQKPEWRRLIALAHNADQHLTEKDGATLVPYVLKQIYAFNDDPWIGIRWAQTAIRAWIAFAKKHPMEIEGATLQMRDVLKMVDEYLGRNEADEWERIASDARDAKRREFENACEIVTRSAEDPDRLITFGHKTGNKTYQVVIVNSDSHGINPAARSLRFAACVQVRSNGSIAVFTHLKDFPMDMEKIVAEIRKAELFAGCKNRAAIEQLIARNVMNGETCDAECRWYFSNGSAILNGSETHPDVPPTRLTGRQIAEIIRDHAFPGGTVRVLSRAEKLAAAFKRPQAAPKPASPPAQAAVTVA